jgi:hypothetical protein
MLRFMVLGAPRSGTAWVANWLSIPGRVCLHDPLWDHHYPELDNLPHVWGIACTALAYLPEWVNAHQCPKVILHRSKAEIDCALAQFGLPEVPQRLLDCLWMCQGLHTEWTDLFTPYGAKEIHEHLEVGAFDLERWEMLRHLIVTSHWQQRRVFKNAIAAKRNLQEMGLEALS